MPLVLTDEDRAELAGWLEGELRWLAERARIVLACAEPGSGVARVAAELGSTRMTVRKWRRRFATFADLVYTVTTFADPLATGAARERAWDPATRTWQAT